MPRPPDLPKFETIGQRVKWWRQKRGIDAKALAKKCGISAQTLSGLERGEQKRTGVLHLIAEHLGLNAHYLETDNGEPEAGNPPDPQTDLVKWPLSDVTPADLDGLNKIERSYVERRMLDAISEVKSERRKTKKA